MHGGCPAGQELPDMLRAFRPPLALAATAVLAAGGLLLSAPGAQARPATAATSAATTSAGHARGYGARPGVILSAAARAALSQPDSTGASDITDLGAGGWQVQSSAVATQTGAQISAPGFSTAGWLPVSNDDAGAPGTEIEALAQNGQCPGDTSLQPVNLDSDSPDSVYYSDNMENCYGYMSKIGADTVPEFDVPWWWRTTFTASLSSGQYATLVINGVIGSANVWVNGTEVATSSTVTGDYTQFTFPVTSLLASGANSVAIEVNPNNPTTMYTLDNVDWTQIPPDNNTGIQFPVQLETDGALSDGNAYIEQTNTASLSSSALTVDTSVTNHTTSAQTGVVSATITPPGTGTAITVSQTVTVAPSSTQAVTFTPASYPSLTIASPQVWWPYQMGAQPLYTLQTSVLQGGTVLNTTSETFGIRNVTSYLTSGTSAGAPDGARAFDINGVPLVIRGGGFDPNIFLYYSAASITGQLALMQNMGLNTIRLEGHIMPPDFFSQADAAGMLINAGFQCCDAWAPSGSLSAQQQSLLQLSAQTLGQELRNHPSVFSFQWSDNAPTKKQESVSLTGFADAGFQDPLISSAEYNSSPQLGWSGEKEGPYDWVPPNYWYDTTHFDTDDSTQTNAGGSWGYDSEQSAGDTVPTIDSLDRFMSASDLASLWQTPKANQYHANYEGTSHKGYHFGTLYNLDTAISSRYGAWSSLDQYVEEAQVQNYEDTRAQFEAFIDHANNTPVPSTGTIYWEMNKGWPSLLWTLYGSDSDQPGAYFGAQEANRSVHALYALDNGTVTLDNLSGTTQSGLSVESKVYSLAGSVLDDQTTGNLSLAPQQVLNNVLTPKVPAATTPPAAASTYFVELLLRTSSGSVLDRNVYWLSTQPDITNWTSTLDNPQATMTQYANLTALQSLPAGSVSATAATVQQSGPDGANLATTVTITNTSASTVAFFLRADVRRGTAGGTLEAGDNELQSSIWQGNDITLFPGESQTLKVTYDSSDLQGYTPVITVSGWNLAQQNLPAPVP
jgi:exo-1,4-beta-D-glucosaminidase